MHLQSISASLSDKNKSVCSSNKVEKYKKKKKKKKKLS